MNKFKIISYYKMIDDNKLQRSYIGAGKDSNTSFNSLVNVYKQLTSKYCELHNYAFQFNNITDKDLQPIIENKNKFKFFSTLNEKEENFNNIGLYKLLMIYNELLKNDSEYIVFLEADVLVSNPNICLEQFIDDQHEIWLSHGNQRYDCIEIIQELTKSLNLFLKDSECIELFMTNIKDSYQRFEQKTGIKIDGILKGMSAKLGSCNEGFLIVKNTENMKNLFKLICNNFYLSYNAFTYKKNRYAPDGYLLLYFLNSEKFLPYFAYMNSYSQGHILGAYEGRYNEDKSFLQHNYSVMNVNDRLKFGQKLKLNKWWKQIIKNDQIKNILLEVDNISNFPKLKDFNQKNQNIQIYFDVPFYNKLKFKNQQLIYKKVLQNCSFVKIWNGEHIDKIITNIEDLK